LGTPDSGSIPRKATWDERAKAQETVERLDRYDPSLLDPMGVDVWIDGEGLIRRERVTIDESYEGVRTRGYLTIDFLDFGDDVGVELPDEDETVDVTDRMAEQLDSP
jgi:hypothetical protein